MDKLGRLLTRKKSITLNVNRGTVINITLTS